MKKFKKILSLILATITLCLAFASCNANNVTDGSDSTNSGSQNEGVLAEGALSKEDIKKLVIVRPETIATEEFSAINTLKNKLNEVFDATIKIVTDKNDVGEGEIPFIIGNTKKTQSAEALEQLEDFGYVFGHYDNSIVINSRYSYYLLEGINAFIEEYVKDGATSLNLPKDLVKVEKEAHIIAENGKANYGVVFGKLFDEKVKLYQNKLFLNTKAKLINTSKLNPSAAEYEVLIGDTGRPESEEALSLIGYGDAIIVVINKKIVVRGWYEETTEKALERFMSLLDTFNEKDKKCAFIPGDYQEILSGESVYNTDIPEYVGGKITCGQDVGQDNFLIYVEDTNIEEFEAYKKLLANSGYTLYTQYNDLNSVKSATFKSDKTMVHTYYIENEKAVKIVTAPMSKTTLPPVVNQPTVEKKVDSSIVQVMLDYYDKSQRNDGNYGNSYVIRLDDGSLVVYDGGATYSDSDIERLWGVMQKQAIKVNGKVVVAGWIITHEHGDHVNGMARVLEKYGSQIKVESVYCNKVTEKLVALSGGRTNYIDTNKMYTAQQKTGFKVVRLHTGQRFWIRNAMFEVLYTPEDIYPNGIKDYETYGEFNDTSMVTRMTIDGTTMMNLGDVYAVGSNFLTATYGSELKSDLSTIAHHGWGGASIPLYSYIKAEKYFFPFAQWRYDTILADDRKYTQWAVDQYNAYDYTPSDVLRYVTDQVGKRNIIIADHYSKEVFFNDKNKDADNYTVVLMEPNLNDPNDVALFENYIDLRTAQSQEEYNSRYTDRENYRDANK